MGDWIGALHRHGYLYFQKYELSKGKTRPNRNFKKKALFFGLSVYFHINLRKFCEILKNSINSFFD